jgi:hypothetical protein
MDPDIELRIDALVDLLADLGMEGERNSVDFVSGDEVSEGTEAAHHARTTESSAKQVRIVVDQADDLDLTDQAGDLEKLLGTKPTAVDDQPCPCDFRLGRTPGQDAALRKSLPNRLGIEPVRGTDRPV